MTANATLKSVAC